MLGEGDHGLAGGVAVDEAAGLELAVVEAATEAQLTQHLRRDRHPEPSPDSGRQAGAPGREHRYVGLAEQPGNLAEREHPVGGHVVDAG